MKLSLVCLSLAATLILVGSLLAPTSSAQSLISGSVTGTVTDPSGAAVPNATVTLKSNDTGAAQSTTTNSTPGRPISHHKSRSQSALQSGHPHGSASGSPRP